MIIWGQPICKHYQIDNPSKEVNYLIVKFDGFSRKIGIRNIIRTGVGCTSNYIGIGYNKDSYYYNYIYFVWKLKFENEERYANYKLLIICKSRTFTYYMIIYIYII